MPTTLSVGIMSGKELAVRLNGDWLASNGETFRNQELRISRPCEFSPLNPDSTFTLRDVIIGKSYHWERKEDQTFTGKLRIITEGDELTAINTLPIEHYLVSVISSEMSATAALEFLKAAAVISRSWVVRTIIAQASARKERGENTNPQPNNHKEKLISWQDHEEHTLYDVCADDHCQRYQGITRATNPNVQRAVEETRGEVLTYEGEVCDCRFSKCCGGRTEVFSTCWQDKDVPYLQSIEDIDPKDGTILCNTHDKSILSQVLNTYDLETPDFFRWQVSLTQSKLRKLLKQKLNLDLGDIIELRPVKRGASGRIYELEIVGNGGKQRLIIGKELTIRNALSDSHLYSSAFEVEHIYNKDNTSLAPDRIILHGHGWGHGVGLCQVGAAVMGSKGYDYRTILAHYYPDTAISNYQSIDTPHREY